MSVTSMPSIVTIPALIAAAALGHGTREGVSVIDIRAHPFCDAEGRVAEQDLLSDPAPVLWNAIIGEGQLECATHSTLLIVVLSTPPHRYLGDTWVHVSATFETMDGDSTVVWEHQLGVTSWEGRYYVPEWLSQTGCDPVRIRAWVRDDEKGAREEMIGFACGE